MPARMLAPALPAWATKTESPQAEFLGLRACGGVGQTETIVSGQCRKMSAPVRPDRLESQGPLPSPRFEPPGSNGRYRSHAWIGHRRLGLAPWPASCNANRATTNKWKIRAGGCESLANAGLSSRVYSSLLNMF